MYTRIRLLLLIRTLNSSFFFLSNFQHWNFSSLFSRELSGLEDWNLVYTWTVGRCIMSTRIRLLLLIHPFISSFFFLSNFQHWNFWSHFSRELWGLEDWNLEQTWRVGRCIMYTRIRLLLLICPFISSFFFLSNFQHWNFSSLFSGTMRPRRLKIGILVDSGQMYHIYQIQAAPAYSSLHFFILLSLHSNIKISVKLFSGTVRPRRLKLGTNVDIVDWCIVYTGIRLLWLFVPLFHHFSFSKIIKL